MPPRTPSLVCQTRRRAPLCCLPFSHLVMTAPRHFSQEACSHTDLDTDAAPEAEDITIAKERTAQGRWIWTLSSHFDERELEDVAPPAPQKFNTFNTFNIFNTFDPIASCHRTE